MCPSPPDRGHLEVKSPRGKRVNECPVGAVVAQGVVTVVSNRAAGTAHQGALDDDVISVLWRSQQIFSGVCHTKAIY